MARALTIWHCAVDFRAYHGEAVHFCVVRAKTEAEAIELAKTIVRKRGARIIGNVRAEPSGWNR